MRLKPLLLAGVAATAIVAGLVFPGIVYAATLPPAAGYADLLDPVPNAASHLFVDDLRRERVRHVELAQYYEHHHSSYEHDSNWYHSHGYTWDGYRWVHRQRVEHHHSYHEHSSDWYRSHGYLWNGSRWVLRPRVEHHHHSYHHHHHNSY